MVSMVLCSNPWIYSGLSLCLFSACPVLPLCAAGVVLWAVVFSLVVLLGAMLVFWKWKVCKKRVLVLRRKREFLKL